VKVICPYCNSPAKLVDSAIVYHGRSYGMIWDCRPCDAYVGVHKNSKKFVPLGRMANAELREWKKKAHAVFDPLWRPGGILTRDAAYRKLQEVMGMTKEQAHIGKFDVAECKKLVEMLGI
jgi:3-mercaptopyruvate sulfurtransferase SseA